MAKMAKPAQDWLVQGERDLAPAGGARNASRCRRASSAAQRPAEDATKALHLRVGQEARGRVRRAGGLQNWAWVALTVLLFAAAMVSGGQAESGGSLTLSGAGWSWGTFRGTGYSERESGISLVPAAISLTWSVDFPDTIVTDVLVDEWGRIYVTGAKRKGSQWELWLGALTPDSAVAWQTTGLASPSKEWSHGLALARLSDGNLVLTGYAGDRVLVSGFAPSGRTLWQSRPAGDERSLGQDIVAWEQSVYVATTYRTEQDSQGWLLCFDTKGELLWRRPLGGSLEITRLVRHGDELLALWRGQDGWSVSAVTRAGDVQWTVACPTALHAAALVAGDQWALVVGHELDTDGRSLGARVLQLIPGPKVVQTVAAASTGFVARGAAGGRGGALGVVGSDGTRGVLLMWGPDWRLLQTEALDWGPETQLQAIAYGGDGRWVLAGTMRLPESTSSRVSSWAPRPGEIAGEYVGPVWDLDPVSPPEALVVRASSLVLGKVRVVLEVSGDGFASVSGRWEWEVRAEEERIPLHEMPWAPSVRVTVMLSGTGIGSPVVHEVTLESGQRGAEPTGPTGPAGVPTVPTETEPARAAETDHRIAAAPAVGLAETTTFSFSLGRSDDVETGWTWDFGDGAVGSGNPAKHTYRLPGRYTVRALAERGEAQAQAEVVVYQAVVKELTLPFQQPHGRLVAGDFNGDGWTDLAVWAEGSASVYVYTGTGDGQFSYRGSGEFPFPPAWVQPGDLDGDGLDDLVFSHAAGSAEIGYLKGSPTTAVEAARTLILPFRVSYPVSSYPRPRRTGMVFVGVDEAGRGCACWLRLEGGQVKWARGLLPAGNPTVVSFDFDADGAFEQLFMGLGRAWVVWSAPRQLQATFVSSDLLGVGHFDGDRHPDALVLVLAEVMVWCPITEMITTIAAWSRHDRWLGGDVSGAGTDQVIQVDAAGSVKIHFLNPFPGDVVVSLAFAPANALLVDLGGGAGQALLVTSAAGQVAVLSLTTR